MISFNQIPSQLRVPLFYAEFDNSRAVQGSATQIYRILMIGSMLGSGTADALTPVTVSSAAQAQLLFGAGSLLADMVAKYFLNNSIQQLVCVGIDDDGSGVAAGGSITLSGSPTKAGTLSYMIGGRNIKIGCSTSDTPSTLGLALKNAINADILCLVGATNATHAYQVDLVAKNKGAFGNEIDVRDSYFDGEALPPGIVSTVIAMNSGATNPDVSDVFPNLTDTQYILIVSPFTDTANLAAMETELTARFGPLAQNDGYAVYGKRASYGSLITLGDSKNSQFTTIFGVAGPSSPWHLSAAAVGQIAASASIDPARPFQTLVVAGILAPNDAERFNFTERNNLLFNGIATFDVDPNGNCFLEGVITTYQQNSFSSPDDSYLYLTTLLTLSFLRFDLKARITSRFPRHKLADDGTRFAQGQAVVTPGSIKAEVITKFQEWEEAALVEGFDQFKADLIVERDSSNVNRVNILLPPNLVNQLVVAASKIQFLL